ncbi:MAG: class I SAM-dependent methyltransferase [Verrucomicrobia bacterium]|nr:class I SAM-dependent methyltransferase [Verrucomicrobiota bacterium]
MIPPIQVRELLPAESVFRLLEPDTTSGNVSGYELAIINALVVAVRPAACFEIGTFDGRTTINLAANAPVEGRIYTLDLPPEGLGHTRHSIACGDEKYIQKPQSGARFLNTSWAARITQLYGDSATFNFAPYEGKMDLVFVDGSHSYEYVKSDTRAALKLLKPDGGVILWHDYGSPYWKGLTRALNELRQEIPELATMRHLHDTMLVYWRRGH